MITDWECSALQLASLVLRAKEVGIYEKTAALCSPEVRAALENPNSKKWHQGAVITEVVEAIAANEGAVFLEEFYYQLTKNSFGPLIAPALQIALVLTGRSPSTIFSRLATPLKFAARHAACSWKENGDHSGELRIEYPNDIQNASSIPVWSGSLRFITELAGATLTIAKADFPTPNVVRFELSWKMPK